METEELFTGPHQVTLERWISCAPFEKLLGIEILEARNGQSYLTMPFVHQLAQGKGLAHGGAIVALADTSVAMAIKSILPPDSRFGTISLNAKFLGPVTKGVLAVRAEVKLLDDQLVQGNAMVSDEEERLVMEFSAIFKLGREVKIATPRLGD